MRTVLSAAVLCSVCLLSTAGCAGHQIQHNAVDESLPHITWEIRAGGAEGDARFVCRSTEPNQACVLDASTTERPNEVTAHLYLHPVKEPTSYLGFMRLEFLSTPEREGEGDISISVPPGSRPVSVTCTGAVTSKPGSYALRIVLDALQPGMTTPKHIAQEIKITIR